MTAYETLKIDREGKLVLVTLNRPDAANGLNLLMAQELAHLGQTLDADSDVKAVILTGAGRFFCGGGDIKAMRDFGDDVGVQLKLLADTVHRAVSSFARMRAPVIVAVNGLAAGAGLSLAAIGDLVVASDKAQFMMAYSKIGLSPDGSSSYYIPRLIGIRRTQELMFTNRMLGADEALDWGLVTRVVPDSDVLQEARKMADLILNGAAQSNANIKALLLQTFDNSLETQMEIEGRLIAKCAVSADGREGVAAFLEKRAPNYE